MRGTPPLNIALLISSPWFYVGCAVVLASCLLLMRASHRRQEARRRNPRYRFDERGRLVGAEPPPAPHAMCTWIVCYQPERREGCPKAGQ